MRIISREELIWSLEDELAERAARLLNVKESRDLSFVYNIHADRPGYSPRLISVHIKEEN